MADGIYVPIHQNYLMQDRTVWGKEMWRQLHERPDLIGDDLSNEDQWLQGFMESIPCEQCKWHTWTYFRDTPPDYSSNGNYRLYLWWFHQKVNLRLGKPIFPWPKTWPPSPIKLRDGLFEP